MTLNHIHLNSKNVKRSENFYNSIFGFTKKNSHGNGVFIENDSGFLIAIDTAEKVSEFPAWFHLGFCLSTKTLVLEMYKKCNEQKVNIVRELMHEKNEFASFFIADPDGYKIEISWHKES